MKFAIQSISSLLADILWQIRAWSLLWQISRYRKFLRNREKRTKAYLKRFGIESLIIVLLLFPAAPLVGYQEAPKEPETIEIFEVDALRLEKLQLQVRLAQIETRRLQDLLGREIQKLMVKLKIEGQKEWRVDLAARKATKIEVPKKE